MTRSLYRKCKLTLVFCACSGNSSGNDLSLFGSEFDQTFVVFVVDVDIAALAEPADLSLLYFFYWYHFNYSLILCPLFFSSSDSSFDKNRSKDSSVNVEGSSSEACPVGISVIRPRLFRNCIRLALISTIERL